MDLNYIIRNPIDDVVDGRNQVNHYIFQDKDVNNFKNVNVLNGIVVKENMDVSFNNVFIRVNFFDLVSVEVVRISKLHYVKDINVVMN